MTLQHPIALQQLLLVPLSIPLEAATDVLFTQNGIDLKNLLLIFFHWGHVLLAQMENIELQCHVPKCQLHYSISEINDRI